VLVHGSLRDHRVFDPLVAELRATTRTFALDRRGFGGSGDAPGYAIERDFDDVAVVVDAVATRSGGPVALFGHSYGAGCAMGAAGRTPHVHRLVLYEPGLGIPYPAGWIDAHDALLAAGRAGAVVEAVLRDILELPGPAIDARRADADGWATLLRAASTVLREARVEDGWAYRPGMFDAVDARALFLLGSETPAVLRDCTTAAVAALPGARTRVLEGHAHLAIHDNPALVAGVIRAWTATAAPA
jgi:pimeloyl-ACP methyl ester carboxylesterase